MSQCGGGAVLRICLDGFSRGFQGENEGFFGDAGELASALGKLLLGPECMIIYRRDNDGRKRYPASRKSVAWMSADTEDNFPEKAGVPRKWLSEAGALWLRVTELWLTAAVVAFFLIRILGSQTAKRLLSGFGHSHFQ